MSRPAEPKYGWRVQRPDHRDYKFLKCAKRRLSYNPQLQHFSLQSEMPDVYDQVQTSSCTGQSIGAATAHAHAYSESHVRIADINDFEPSRLFIYYGERDAENSTNVDSGGAIRDGVSFVNQFGCCDESLWPFDPDCITTKPSDEAYQQALDHKALLYMSVDQHVEQIKLALQSGYPVIFGFSVYDAFESDEVARTGILHLPGSDERQQGGHAVLIVGYDESRQMFLVRNSWGSDWGIGGYYWMPYDYVVNPDLADDFWIIEKLAA